MIKKIGVITIGQSPRTDLIPEIEKFFPAETRFIQKGVLDNMDDHHIGLLIPEPNQITLVSRLKDGTAVTMGKEKILPIIQEIIDGFNNEDIALIILACTGEFKSFRSGIPVIYPDFLLSHVVKGTLRNESSIGVVVPLVSQFGAIQKKWHLAGFNVLPVALSPYDCDENTLINVLKELNNLDVNTIVLDCIGYNDQMKKVILMHTEKNVILSRNIVFRSVAELF